MKALILGCENQYNILSYFVEGICNDLSLMGIANEYYAMPNDDRAILNQSADYLKHFDFCLSINAVGLDLDIEGQGSFSDVTGKPTLVLLVDHPIHLFKRFYGKKVILLCVDQEHVAFANLVGYEAHYFPHGVVSQQNGFEFKAVDLADKSQEILFPVSYFSITEWLQLLEPLWGQIGQAVEHATSVTRFMQFIGILPYGNRPASLTLDDSMLTICKAVDFYLRGQSRLQTLSLYQQANIRLTVIGKGSERYQEQFPSHHYLPAMDIHSLLPRIRQAKFMVHNSPGFERGLHDRLVIPMNIGTAVISHNSPFVNEVLHRPGGILTEIDKRTLDIGAEDYRQMCLSNYQQIQQSHTWRQRFTALFSKP